MLGLLSEDQKLLRPFPDRTATQFRNSPQGSFFDGSDHVDLFKEQQNRVLDRQMREMILRKQAQETRDTFHLNRHNQNSFGDEISVADCGMMTPASVSDAFTRNATIRTSGRRCIRRRINTSRRRTINNILMTLLKLCQKLILLLMI